MMRMLSCAAALVVMTAWTTAEAQTYTYRFKQKMSSHVGEENVQGTLTVKRLRRTAQGYVAYHGTKTFQLGGGKIRREIVSLIEVRTSKGTRVFAVSAEKKPFWMYVFRKTKRGITATMLDAWGFTEEAKRVAGDQLDGRLEVSGKNKFGAWSAVLTTTSNSAVKWQAGKVEFWGNRCAAGDVYVIGIDKSSKNSLFCYTLKGRNLSGEQAMNNEIPASVTETLTLQSVRK